MATEALLMGLGFAVGALGTLVGAGGGFILMPVLFILYPLKSSAELTAISLAVVFLNSASGSVAYIRKGRVDFLSAGYFVLAAIPGAILGALTTPHLSRQIFDPLFAVLLALASGYLFFRPLRLTKAKVLTSAKRGYVQTLLTEKDGTRHKIAYSLPKGLGISAGVGFISSLIGIGGGIIHVPAMIQILGFPVHIATATSHFILGFTSLSGSLVHGFQGVLLPGLEQVLWIAPGVILGAQLGARLSSRIHGVWIVRALALALAAVALRLFFSQI
jgi:uncharacterized membrane protein YfcA